jgi:hypothetical protein
MLLGSCLWMRPQKMMQHMEEDQDMLFVVTRLSDTDIVNNHVANFLNPLLLVHKVAGKRGRSDLGQMLVFGDGEHLALGQAAKGYAIL